MPIDWFKKRKARKDAAQALYRTVVAQSRDPVFYTRLGVADSIDGRFDLIILHVFLVVDRLRNLGPEGQRLAQALFDTMFRTMDLTLREMGIGDLGVPKHMKKMMKAFNGRMHAYHEALEAGNEAALQLALARNIYRAEGEAVPAGSETLADYTLAVHAFLQGCGYENFTGALSFPAPVMDEKKEAAYA